MLVVSAYLRRDHHHLLGHDVLLQHHGGGDLLFFLRGQDKVIVVASLLKDFVGGFFVLLVQSRPDSDRREVVVAEGLIEVLPEEREKGKRSFRKNEIFPDKESIGIGRNNYGWIKETDTEAYFII